MEARGMHTAQHHALVLGTRALALAAPKQQEQLNSAGDYA